MRSTPHRSRALLAAALTSTLLLAACGDDDTRSDDTPSDDTPSDDTAAPAPTAGPDTSDPAADPTADPAAAPTDGCDAFATVSGPLLAGMVDPAEVPAVLEALVAAAPDGIEDPSATVADGVSKMFADEGDPFGDPAFIDALAVVGDHYFDHCEVAASIEATGVDYGFGGVPAEVPAGRVAIRFTNESTLDEPHELVLLRRPEGDTTPAAELAALPPEELMGSYEFVGVAFADEPGSSNVTFLDLEPGSYVAICTLPTQGEPADPHAAHGMVQDLEVTA